MTVRYSLPDDYCCLACNDGKWPNDMEVDVDYDEFIPPIAPLGTIILRSKPKCLYDYIERIKWQVDDARYQAFHEKQLRLQAESSVDIWKDYHRNLAENFKRLVDEELARLPTYYQRERLRDWLIHAEAMIELTGGWD